MPPAQTTTRLVVLQAVAAGLDPVVEVAVRGVGVPRLRLLACEELPMTRSLGYRLPLVVVGQLRPVAVAMAPMTPLSMARTRPAAPCGVAKPPLVQANLIGLICRRLGPLDQHSGASATVSPSRITRCRACSTS